MCAGRRQREEAPVPFGGDIPLRPPHTRSCDCVRLWKMCRRGAGGGAESGQRQPRGPPFDLIIPELREEAGARKAQLDQ